MAISGLSLRYGCQSRCKPVPARILSLAPYRNHQVSAEGSCKGGKYIRSCPQSDGSRFTVKQLEKTKKSLRRRLEKLENREKKDDVVTFEELGVDRLYVDEAHYYKNAFLYTKMRNVAGIAQNEAQKSADMEGEEEQDEEKEEHQSLHDRITAIKQNNQRQEGKEAAMRTIEACIG